MPMKLLHVVAKLAAVFVLAAQFGCQSGSSIVVGQTRAPIPAEQVKLYIKPPAKFEVIGLVEATGRTGWTDQAKMNRAINELKEQAGKLGANGILISTSGDKQGGIVGGTSGGAFFAGNVYLKSASGQAIFVTEE